MSISGRGASTCGPISLPKAADRRQSRPSSLSARLPAPRSGRGGEQGLRRGLDILGVPETATRPVPSDKEIAMTTRNTPVMDALVDFVLGLELAALPPAVVEAANRSMTDWLGTALRGSIEPLAEAIASVVTATGGEPQATVVGRDQ